MKWKTIKIKEKVYDELIKLKRSDENFSDLLSRLAKQVNGQKLEAFLGAWDMDPEEFNRISEEMKALRERNTSKFIDFD